MIHYCAVLHRITRLWFRLCSEIKITGGKRTLDPREDYDQHYRVRVNAEHITQRPRDKEIQRVKPSTKNYPYST